MGKGAKGSSAGPCMGIFAQEVHTSLVCGPERLPGGQKGGRGAEQLKEHVHAAPEVGGARSEKHVGGQGCIRMADNHWTPPPPNLRPCAKPPPNPPLPGPSFLGRCWCTNPRISAPPPRKTSLGHIGLQSGSIKVSHGAMLSAQQTGQMGIKHRTNAPPHPRARRGYSAPVQREPSIGMVCV